MQTKGCKDHVKLSGLQYNCRADQILVVADGKITQNGTHEELMAEDGIYRNFVNERKEAVSWKLQAS